MDRKAMTLRLARDQADALEAIADVDQIAVTDVVRTAIAEHIEKRRMDEQFQERLRGRLERNKRILDQLRSR